MLMYHVFFFGGFYKLWHTDLSAQFWDIHRFIVPVGFIFLAGVSSSISRTRHRLSKYAFRFFRLTIYAATITLVSLWLFPTSPIFFGILHLAAVLSLMASLTTRLHEYSLIVAACFLGIDFALDGQGFWWLGLGSVPMYQLDFFPIFPWAAYFFFGMGCARWVLPLLQQSRPTKKPSLIEFAGRNSLNIYVIHIPVMILCFEIAVGLVK